MKKLIERFKKHRAINAYLHKLPALLRRDYGAKNNYKPQQIQRTVLDNNLSNNYLYYAIALYASPVQFYRFFNERGESHDYDATRGEIAGAYFQGDTNFQDSEAFNALSQSSELGFSDSGYSGGPGHDSAID